MLNEPIDVLLTRQKRSFVRAHYLIRIEARNLTSGAIEAIGFWDGEDHVVFNPGGTGDLEYLGANRILSLPEFDYEAGLDARTYEIGLSQTDEATQIAVRQYDPKYGRVYIFRAEWDDGGAMIGTPRLIFKGFIDGTPIETPAIDGESGGITLRIVSDAKLLTFFGSHMKNYDFHSKRNGDPFRKYSSIKTAYVPWGTEFQRKGALEDWIASRNARPRV